MTFSERAVEAALSAYNQAIDAIDTTSSEPCSLDDIRYHGLKSALTAALAVDGLALVPKEPTREMLEAAVPFPTALCDERSDSKFTERMQAATLVERMAARQRYIDMLAAASDGEVG